jgi:hypothetical protein
MYVQPVTVCAIGRDELAKGYGHVSLMDGREEALPTVWL